MTLLKVIASSPDLKENDEIFKDLIHTVGLYLISFNVFTGDI